MLLIAISMIAYIRFSILNIVTITVFSFGIYHFTANTSAISEWLLHGKKHYELQLQVNRLGGIEGIIQRVKQKLEKDPTDAQGWLILGKMYLMQGDEKKAKFAFDKAKEL